MIHKQQKYLQGGVFVHICTDINGPQRISPTKVVEDPLTFPLELPECQSFHLSCKISQHLLDGMV